MASVVVEGNCVKENGSVDGREWIGLGYDCGIMICIFIFETINQISICI